jgi:hypothetical protein
MAEINKGAAVFWAIGSSFTYVATGYTLDASTVINTQSQRFRKEADMVQIRGNQGATKAVVHYDPTNTLSVEVQLTSDTIAHVKADIAKAVPPPGTLVTVTDTDDTQISGTHSGKYQVINGEKSKVNTNTPTVTLELKQWADNDLSATAS